MLFQDDNDDEEESSSEEEVQARENPYFEPTIANPVKPPDLKHLEDVNFEIVYEPSADSYLFVNCLEADAEFLRSMAPTLAVEIGVGSGIISSYFHQILEFCAVVGFDINPIAAQTSQMTYERNLVPGNVVLGDLLTNVRHGIVDVLLFNPPYVPTGDDELNKNDLTAAWAGGNLGREVTDQLLEVVQFYLRPGGVFYLVTIEENKPKEICDILTSKQFMCTILARKRVPGEILSIIKAVFQPP